MAPVIVRRSRVAAQIRYKAAAAAVSETRPRVLDVGCGLGLGSDSFPQATQYVGLDKDLDAIGFAACQFRLQHKIYLCTSADHIPFRDSYFDLVVMMDVIEHMETSQMLRVLDEVYRVMAYGGKLCLSTPDGRLNLPKRVLGRKHARSHIVEYSSNEVIGYLQSTGFHNVVAKRICFPELPDSKVGAVFTHLLAENPWAFSLFERIFKRLKYGNYLYVGTK
jgi:2-polyprenyl-3-methyl-5-hydroxy-6-metoxy-1,4-benzoquinol methylase